MSEENPAITAKEKRDFQKVAELLAGSGLTSHQQAVCLKMLGTFTQEGSAAAMDFLIENSQLTGGQIRELALAFYGLEEDAPEHAQAASFEVALEKHPEMRAVLEPQIVSGKITLSDALQILAAPQN